MDSHLDPKDLGELPNALFHSQCLVRAQPSPRRYLAYENTDDLP